MFIDCFDVVFNPRERYENAIDQLKTKLQETQ